MGRTIFWFAMGVGVTAFIVVKGRQLAAKATPAGLAQTAQDKARDASERAGGFLQTLTSAMHEREVELRHDLGLDEHSEAPRRAQQD